MPRDELVVAAAASVGVVAAADLAWALRSDLDRPWWVVNGWLAASYAASWIVVRDDVPDRTITVKDAAAESA